MASNAPVDHSLDGESQSGSIITTSVALVVFSGTLVLLRLFTRGILLKAFGLDDVTIAISEVNSLRQPRDGGVEDADHDRFSQQSYSLSERQSGQSCV